MTPGPRFSATTSHSLIRRRAISLPSAAFRSTTMLRLLLLSSRKKKLSTSGLSLFHSLRARSPPFGFSILITSAPSQASICVQDGPAWSWVKSMMRMPSSAWLICVSSKGSSALSAREPHPYTSSTIERHRVRWTEGSMPETRTGAAMLDAARAMRPRIIAQRDAIEAGRRLPEDLAQDLARAGFFRIFLPKAYGGLDMTPADGIAVFEELVKADASVAWCVWNGNTHWTAAQLSPEAARTRPADPEIVTANSTRPSGRAD